MISFFSSPVKKILVLLIITAGISSGALAAVSNQSYILTRNVTPDAGAGPDYVITQISLPEQSSWIEPGMSITPNVSIKNSGADDMTPGSLQISASLGTYQLISRNSTITPMKRGEERSVTLEYLIPDGIPSKEYRLIITLDTEREKEGSNKDNNVGKSSDFQTIRKITPKVKISSCGCS